MYWKRIESVVREMGGLRKDSSNWIWNYTAPARTAHKVHLLSLIRFGERNQVM
jgi:hypothetical protein